MFTLNLTAQDPATTSNDEITGVTIESFFDEQVDIPAGKENYAANIIDGNVDSDWAAQSTTGGKLIFDLEGTYDLAEIQHLTVSKSFAYVFEVLVSTTGTADGDFTDVFGSKQDSNLDATYKSLVFPNIVTGAKYVMLKCYGREGEGSSWNTISELKFYKEGATASVSSNELREVSLYPNPANNQLMLKNFSDQVSKVEVFNLLGKKLISNEVGSSNQVIDTSNLTNGIYLVKLSDANNNSTTKKIVVRHY